MSADVVNLRQARKQKARSDKDDQADKNRAAFGRTKTEKQLTQALNEQARRRHEAGRLDAHEAED